VTLAYSIRLLCLCLVTFLVAYAALASIAQLMAPSVLRRLGRLRAASAARLLFAIRIAPLTGSIFLVVGVCVPSYLWLEPAGAAEETGGFFLALACVCAVISIIRLGRGLRAVLQSAQFVRGARGGGHRIAPGVWVVPELKGVMLAGVLNPTVFLSPEVVQLLSEEELALALRHESAHAIGRDNWKRLAMLVAPGPSALENEWRKFAEWAADDYAASGDESRAILASALVRVARLGISRPACALATSLVESDEDLLVRVHRLLGEAAVREAPRVPGAVIGLATALAAVALHPATLRAAHSLFERVIR